MAFKPINNISLNAELNPICHLLALLEAHHILHISRVRVKHINGDRNKLVQLSALQKLYQQNLKICFKIPTFKTLKERCTNLTEIWETSQNSRNQEDDWSKFHPEDQQKLGATKQNLSPWHLGFVHPYINNTFQTNACTPVHKNPTYISEVYIMLNLQVIKGTSAPEYILPDDVDNGDI